MATNTTKGNVRYEEIINRKYPNINDMAKVMAIKRVASFELLSSSSKGITFCVPQCGQEGKDCDFIDLLAPKKDDG